MDGFFSALFVPPREGKRAFLIGDIAFLLYRFHSGKLQRFLRWLVARLEGGTIYSVTLRRIFAEYHGVEIGMYSSVGCFGVQNFHRGTRIGRYCAIAEKSYSFTTDHPSNTKLVHSFFYNRMHGFVEKDLLIPTRLTIGNDVFIGHQAIILPSVNSIGDGAIIGAGAVVNTDIPPYAIVVGHPARIVRYRFSKEKVRELLESKWWEKSINELLPDIESFRKPLENPQLITAK